MIAVSAFFRNSNYAEAALWFVIAIVVALAGSRMKLTARSRAILAITLVAFGVSDIVEASTGAWWEPWWLLVWKGACLAVFCGMGYKPMMRYLKQRNRGSDPH